jgi:predicted metal-dependent hydrolase
VFNEFYCKPRVLRIRNSVFLVLFIPRSRSFLSSPVKDRSKKQSIIGLIIRINKIRISPFLYGKMGCFNGNVNFHWKCAMAPVEVLHYIVVHELAHLLQNNHTQAFWNEVDKIIPNYDEQVNWLKIHGSGMSL